MNLREFLAVEVMGWHKKVVSPSHVDRTGLETWWMEGYNPEEFCCTDADWDPPNNIEQAVMCAEEWERQGGEFWIHRRGGIHYVTVAGLNNHGRHYGREPELAPALSLPIARAAGWKDE